MKSNTLRQEGRGAGLMRLDDQGVHRTADAGRIAGAGLKRLRGDTGWAGQRAGSRLVDCVRHDRGHVALPAPGSAAPSAAVVTGRLLSGLE